MSFNMRVFAGLIALHLVSTISCIKPSLRYEWKELDFEYSSLEERTKAISEKTFNPKNNKPVGLEVWGDKLFITVPKLKDGVPASLNYVNMSVTTTTSPQLKPYPNWDAHTGKEGKRAEIISAFRVHADRCDRLWVLDNGKAETETGKSEPAIIIYDLKTDKRLKKYTIPADQFNDKSRFVNIAVEVLDCKANTYAYVADIVNAGIVVYSYEKENSWKITHKFFNPEPSASELSGNFMWSKTILVMGISKQNSDGFHTLYFHPMSSSKEYSVSTEYLRNSTIAENKTDEFRLLGSRIGNTQSTVSIFDSKTSVLFSSVVNFTGLSCWNTSNKYSVENQAIIYTNNETGYIFDVKIYNDSFLILTNNDLSSESELDTTKVNFRVLSAPVLEAINGTVCFSDVVEKQAQVSKGSSRTPVSLVALALISCFIGILSKM